MKDRNCSTCQKSAPWAWAHAQVDKLFDDYYGSLPERQTRLDHDALCLDASILTRRVQDGLRAIKRGNCPRVCPDYQQDSCCDDWVQLVSPEERARLDEESDRRERYADYVRGGGYMK